MKLALLRFFLLFLFPLACAGCTRWPGVVQFGPPNFNVAHVVVFWLKKPGAADARRRVILASVGFRRIPGVTYVAAGEMLPSPRENVDKTYDVAVVMWFRDVRALENYQSHPQHQAMLKELGPIVERVVVYDFTRPGVPVQKQAGRPPVATRPAVTSTLPVSPNLEAVTPR